MTDECCPETGGGGFAHVDAWRRSPPMQSGQPLLGAGHVVVARARAVIDVSRFSFVKMVLVTRINARRIRRGKNE